MLLEQNKLDAGIRELRRAVTLAPRSPQFHTNLGVALTASKPQEAIVEFRQALKLDSTYCPARYDLGAALQEGEQENGKLQEAITDLREAIKCEPENAKSHYMLGLALQQSKDIDGAISEFREAIRLLPTIRAPITIWRECWGK